MNERAAPLARRFAPLGSWLGEHGRLVAECASSNDLLWEWAAEGAPHGAVVLALAQTHGRGRQGRSWLSEAGQGLYFSCLLRPQSARSRWPAFGLVAALAVAQCVEARCGLRCALKWPNDVRLRERKLAGLLLEARSIAAGPALVLGIGLNLRAPRDGWPEALASRSIALAELGCQLGAEALASDLCARLGSAWDCFAERGFAAFAAEFELRDDLRGRRIVYDRGGERCQGVADGIEADGALRVRDDAGRPTRLVAGEVHLIRDEA
jgi:BirA family biotin operon repressor/biotin-[acetyl-CoA-carboxylase] ligase